MPESPVRRSVASDGRKGRRVLVVDDDRAILSLETMLLSRSGFEVDTAANGREAAGMLAEGNPYEAIVLDLMMPEMNGFDFLEHLRSLDGNAASRVVVVTAAVRDTRQRMPSDVHRVLYKPFDVDEFRDAVQACADASRT